MPGLGDVRYVLGRERKTFHAVRRDWKARGWGGGGGGSVGPSFKYNCRFAESRRMR